MIWTLTHLSASLTPLLPACTCITGKASHLNLWHNPSLLYPSQPSLFWFSCLEYLSSPVHLDKMISFLKVQVESPLAGKPFLTTLPATPARGKCPFLLPLSCFQSSLQHCALQLLALDWLLRGQSLHLGGKTTCFFLLISYLAANST